MSLPPKDPDSIESYPIIWCDEDGTNVNAKTNTGELMGATISTSTWVVPAGITKVSDNTDETTIKGTTYPVDTIANIVLSGGTHGESYPCGNTITTSDGRTLPRTIIILVQEQ